MWICFITEPAELHFNVILLCLYICQLKANLSLLLSPAFSSLSRDSSSIKIRFLGERRLVYLDLISFLPKYGCLHDLIIVKLLQNQNNLTYIHFELFSIFVFLF